MNNSEIINEENSLNQSPEIKVSVIMPIYNAYEYLRPAIDSVVSQTLKEIEIICIDDGSTDHSVEIVKEYQKTDERIRIIAENNAGPALARNNGIKRARGEYLAFLDADDFCEPTFLESLYELAKKEDLDIAIGRYDIYNSRRQRFEDAVEGDHHKIYKSGVVTSKNEHPDTILMSTVGSAWNKIFKRKFVFDKGLLFLQDVRMYEDVYFTVCAVSLAERIGKVDAILMHHRIHSEQQRAKTFSKYFSQVPTVYAKIKEFLTSHGMYIPLKVSFLNLSASRSYKIFNLLGKDEKADFYNLLHTEYAEILGWGDAVKENVESDEVFSFVSDVLLLDYKQYKRKCDREEELSERKEGSGEKKESLFKRLFKRK